MSIKEVTYYQVKCDGCDADGHEDGEYSAWADDGSAREEAADSDWLVEVGAGKLDFCPGCSEGRMDDEPADCEHEEVLTTGPKQWKCPACGLTLGEPEPTEATEEPKPGWVANRIKQQAAQRDEAEAAVIADNTTEGNR